MSRIREYAKLARVHSSVLSGLAPVLGAISVGVMELESLVILFFVGICTHIFGFVFNEYMDVDIDKRAKILKDKGIRAKPWTYLTMPLREFRRRYFLLGGYKDGWVGLQVCSLMSWYMLITYLRLRKLYQD